jgi:hypothetical protein
MADTGFISDDLEHIEDTIREVTAGKRVVQVTVQDRIERYSDAQRPDLQKLRDTTRNEIDGIDNPRRQPSGSSRDSVRDYIASFSSVSARTFISALRKIIYEVGPIRYRQICTVGWVAFR